MKTVPSRVGQVVRRARLTYDLRMFTGIIERTGTVRSASARPGGVRLAIAADEAFWRELTIGASVAIDGTCLTIVAVRGAVAEFDVIAETLRCTTLGALAGGDMVNLERALVAGARLDGHFVQGHVDAVAIVSRVRQTAGEAEWTFRLDPEVMKYVIPKGGIALDGISLTVAATARDEFTVALIPTTLARTTLGRKQAGAKVNVETDILVRTVVHTLTSLRPAP